jgi:hypothetical protein
VAFDQEKAIEMQQRIGHILQVAKTRLYRNEKHVAISLLS